MRNLTELTPDGEAAVAPTGTLALDFGSAHDRPPRDLEPLRPRVRIAHPRLWSPGRPHAVPRDADAVRRRGRELAGYSTESGIRSIKVTADGRLALNGRLLDLRGVSLHEQDVSDTALRSTRRTAAADRLGQGARRDPDPRPLPAQPGDRGAGRPLRDPDLVGDPRLPASAPRYLSQPIVAPARPRDSAEQNILANQNHPSVLLWSIGNELPTPGDRARGALHRPGDARSRTSWTRRGPVGDGRSATGRASACQSGVCAARRDRRQRVLRLVRRRRGGDRRSRRARPVPRHAPRLLPDKALFVTRVRLRRQPQRPGRGARDLPVPVQLDRVPPRRVRAASRGSRARSTGAPGLRRQARLGRRRSVRAPRRSCRRAWSTCRATRSRRSRSSPRSTTRPGRSRRATRT